MDKKELILNSSPRIDGCTARALKKVESTLNKEGIETETIVIGNKDILYNTVVVENPCRVIRRINKQNIK